MAPPSRGAATEGAAGRRLASSLRWHGGDVGLRWLWSAPGELAALAPAPTVASGGCGRHLAISWRWLGG